MPETAFRSGSLAVHVTSATSEREEIANDIPEPATPLMASPVMLSLTCFGRRRPASSAINTLPSSDPKAKPGPNGFGPAHDTSKSLNRIGVNKGRDGPPFGGRRFIPDPPS